MKLELYLDDISAEFPAEWRDQEGPEGKTWDGQWKDDWGQWSDHWKNDWPGNWKTDWGGVWGDWKKDWDDWKNNWSENWGADWTGNWGDVWKTNWQSNLGAKPGAHPTVPGPRLLGLKLRDEEFGGIFFDPVSGAVFRGDHQGYEVIRRLNSGEHIPEITAAMMLTQEDVSALVEFLETYNLW
jgi:hypothetical protein